MKYVCLFILWDSWLLYTVVEFMKCKHQTTYMHFIYFILYYFLSLTQFSRVGLYGLNPVF